jgi:hypothetical protein
MARNFRMAACSDGFDDPRGNLLRFHRAESRPDGLRSGGFGLPAHLTGVCLSALGWFGVVVYRVAQRTREIGVRMALGATRRNILRLVLGSVVRWTLAGALAGFVGSWFSALLLQALLFQVSVHDPWPLCAPIALLVTIAFVAGFVPASAPCRSIPWWLCDMSKFLHPLCACTPNPSSYRTHDMAGFRRRPLHLKCTWERQFPDRHPKAN